MLRNLLLSAGLIVTIWVPSALAADVTGRWDVKIISTSDGEVHGVAGFTQNGNRVTGWLGPSEADPIPLRSLSERTSSQSGRIRSQVGTSSSPDVTLRWRETR